MSIQKGKVYNHTRFPPEVLRSGRLAIVAGASEPVNWRSLEVHDGDEVWSFEEEEEFFTAYRRVGVHQAYYSLELTQGPQLRAFVKGGATLIEVRAASRSDIERVSEVFETAAPNCRLPKEQREASLRESLVVFVGHGGSSQWRDLKDHLHDKHGFRVEAFETGARAGLTVIEVLQRLTKRAGFAILVLTAEDEDSGGQLHARENVIHEAGLFQGKLGFARAILLLEQGCHEFSNIAGLQQIRFAKGNVKEAFGEVLATIRREFEVD